MFHKTITKKLARRLIGWGILVCIIMPACIVLIKNITTASQKSLNQFFTPTHALCTITNVYCDKLRATIEHFVEQRTTQQSLLSFNGESFYKELKQNFPIIKGLQWSFIPPQTLKLAIVGTTPYCLVNNTFVLADKKRLFEQAYFSAEFLPKNNIDIAQTLIVNGKLDGNAYNFVHRIPTQYWNTYRITYHASNKITLVPHKALCRCMIITDEKTFFNKKKFNALAGLFTQLCRKGVITKKMMNAKTVPLVFDMRMKNQIIVRGRVS